MLSRNLIILGLVGFVTSFGAHSVVVNLPTYAQQVGVGTFAIGVLIAVYDFSEVIAKPIFGYFADKRGQVMTLWVGLGVFSLASLAFLVVDPRLLIIIRLAQGLGAAAFSVVSVALVAAYFPNARGQSLGIYNALKGAGYVFAPVIGGFVVARVSFSGLFVISAIIGLTVLTLTFALHEPGEPAELADDDDDFNLRELLAPFSDRRLLPWYGIIVVNMFFVGILFGFVPVYLSSLSYDPFTAGLIVGAGTLAYLLIQPLAGSAADRFGTSATIVAGLLASSLSLVGMTFTQGAPLVALVVLGGLGIGIVWTNCDAMISQLAQAGQLAASLGTAGSYKEIGDMLGPLSVGALSQAFGLTLSFVACGAAGLASILLIRRKI
jgi:MFS family permease